MSNNLNNSQSDGRRVVEVTPDFYDRHYRGRRSQRRSQREQLKREFEQLQERCSKIAWHWALSTEEKQLVKHLARVQAPHNLAELKSWIEQGNQLLKRFKEQIAQAEAKREAQLEAERWEQQYERFLYSYEGAQSDVTKLADLYHLAVTLYERGLLSEQVYLEVKQARLQDQEDKRLLALYEEYGSWPDRFLAREAQYRDFVYYARQNHGYDSGHRKGYDPDPRRAWRRQRIKVNAQR